MGGNTENDRVASPESVPIYLIETAKSRTLDKNLSKCAAVTESVTK